MYHKVSILHQDFLTVSCPQLEEQLCYLQRKNYTFISLQQFIDYKNNGTPLPHKPVLCTFDDGYLSNFELALPILEKYKAKAVIFVPTAYIGQTSAWDFNPEYLMSVEQLKALPPHLIELGLHSHQHQNYKHLSFQEIKQDLEQCLRVFKQLALPFVPAFAYPYGGRPKNASLLGQMKDLFRANGIEIAFRIGNRINPFQIKDYFEINRIDVRGTDSLEAFKRKVRWGKIF